MDFLLLILLSALVVFLLIVGRVKNITSLKRRKNLAALINQNQYEYQLLDLRREKDYIKGSIPTSVNRTPEALEATLPTEKMFETIIVYGYSWRQSNRVARYLSDTGYFNVTSFGSVRRWGKPLFQLESEEKRISPEKGEPLE